MCSRDAAFGHEKDSSTEREFFLGTCSDCGPGCPLRELAELDLAEDFAERRELTIGQIVAAEFLRQHGDQLPEDDRGS